MFLVGWGLLYAPLVVPVAKKRDQGERPMSPWLRLYFEVAGAVTISIAAWLMTHFVDKRPFVTLGFAPDRFLRDTLLGLGMGTGMLLLAVATVRLVGCVRRCASSQVIGSALATIGVAMAANTLTQEILVRGYIQQTIQAQSNPMVAVLLSAIIFALLHAGAIQDAPLPAFNLLVTGVLLGMAYAVTGNLWLPIAVHFSWNFLLGPVLGLTVSGQALDGGWQLLALEGPAPLTGGAFGLEGGLEATGATLLGILLLTSLIK